jgi:hypothetical protein
MLLEDQASFWQRLLNSPTCSILTSTKSPSRSHSGGLRLAPTPPGMPVRMTSPAGGHEGGDVGEESWDWKDHLTGIRVLHHTLVDYCLETHDFVRRQLVEGHQSGSERSGEREILTRLGPCSMCSSTIAASDPGAMWALVRCAGFWP